MGSCSTRGFPLVWLFLRRTRATFAQAAVCADGLPAAERGRSRPTLPRRHPGVHRWALSEKVACVDTCLPLSQAEVQERTGWACWEVRFNILRTTWPCDRTPGGPHPATHSRHWKWWASLMSADGGTCVASRGQCGFPCSAPRTKVPSVVPVRICCSHILFNEESIQIVQNLRKICVSG